MLVWYNCVLMAIDERSYLSAKRTKSLSKFVPLLFSSPRFLTILLVRF